MVDLEIFEESLRAQVDDAHRAGAELLDLAFIMGTIESSLKFRDMCEREAGFGNCT